MTAAVFQAAPLFGPERGMAEDFVLFALDRLRMEKGGYLRYLGYYNGELDTEEGADDLFKHTLTNSPAILVAAAQSSYRQKSTARRAYEVTIQVEVLFASGHLRSRPSRLRGDVVTGVDRNDPDQVPSRDPGIYWMMRDAREAILGFPTNLDGMGSFTISREDVVFQHPKVTMWRAVYPIEYAWTQRTREERRAAAVRSVEIDHNIVGDETAANPVIRQERP